VLGGDELRDRRGALHLVLRTACVAERGGLVDEQPRRLDRGLQVGELERDRLLGADRPAERLALVRVPQRVLEAGLDEAGRERGDRDAAVVERGEELGEPAAALAEQVLLRDAAVLERQGMGVGGVPAELVVRRLDCEALDAGRDDDRGDLVVAGLRGDRDERGDRGAGVRDELLGAVDDPLAVLQPGLGLGGPSVGAGLGLGEPEPGERVAGREVGEPALFLLLGAVREDRGDAEPYRTLERDAERLVDASDLLDRDAQAGEVAAAAAVLLGYGQAEQAELAHLGDRFERELVGFVPFGGVRGELGVGELAHDLAERFVVFAQFERHGITSPWFTLT
jgi:hypothetical protein